MLEEIKKLDKQYYMNTFGERLPVAFEKGEGMKLFADDGKEYYDFLGGIAVNALGHSHPKFIKALKAQADKVLHTSSLYYIENQAKLAQKLVEHSSADKVFFCSTGAEANEGALKLAKIYFYKKGIEKYEIISLDKSFHGRTLATVAATGQEKYQKPYRPLVPGFTQVKPNDIEAVKAAVTDKTAAIMIELIQGESGVHPMDKAYVQALRKLCDEKEIILIFDEVQTGMGRCGEWFAHQYYGVEPDIFTSAKALGCGIPIGAVCAKDFVASAFAPGDHGTTYGGNPFACAAISKVIDLFEEEKVLDNVRKVGAYLWKELDKLTEKYDSIIAHRGVGLMQGLVFDKPVAPVINKALEMGLVLINAGTQIIRFVPPLVISEKDVDDMIQILDTCLKELE